MRCRVARLPTFGKFRLSDISVPSRPGLTISKQGLLRFYVARACACVHHAFANHFVHASSRHSHACSSVQCAACHCEFQVDHGMLARNHERARNFDPS